MITVMGCLMEIKTLKNKEGELLQEVLAKTHWDLTKTARLLKITLSQVKRKIKEHGLERADYT
jgi:DNA-binding NtrC family response regulator